MRWFRRNREAAPAPQAVNAYQGNRRVKMLRTVWSAECEWLANRIYDLTDEKADEFIHLGYATGELSREYSPDEIARLVNKNQEIRL